MTTHLTKFKTITVGTLMAAMLFSPAVGFARDKNNDNDKDDSRIKSSLEVKVNKHNKEAEKDRKKENKRNNKECFRAFGHLISSGWKKHNTEIELKSNCFLPFGIMKKIDFRNGTSTTDTTLPLISNIHVETRESKAIVRWDTDENTKGSVYFTTTNPVIIGNAGVEVKNENEFSGKEHSVTLSNLQASTTYYVLIRSVDKAGNVQTSTQVSFTTPATVADTKAPVMSDVLAFSNASNVSIGWKTDEPASAKIYYSSSSPLNLTSTSTLSVEDTMLLKNHFLTVPNLSANTTYYFVLESKDTSGNAKVSSEFSVKTLLGL